MLRIPPPHTPVHFFDTRLLQVMRSGRCVRDILSCGRHPIRISGSRAQLCDDSWSVVDCLFHQDNAASELRLTFTGSKHIYILGSMRSVAAYLQGLNCSFVAFLFREKGAETEVGKSEGYTHRTNPALFFRSGVQQPSSVVAAKTCRAP